MAAATARMVSSAAFTCSHSAQIVVPARKVNKQDTWDYTGLQAKPYLDKHDIWVLHSKLHPLGIQCFTCLTPRSKEFDCHKLPGLLAMSHSFLQHVFTCCKYQIFRARNFPPARFFCCFVDFTFIEAEAVADASITTCSSLHTQSHLSSPLACTEGIVTVPYGATDVAMRNEGHTIPGLSFLPASDGIWMHAKAIFRRLVHDACCSYICCYDCSGTVGAAPKCLSVVSTVQTVSLCKNCHHAQGLYAVLGAQGSGSCGASKHNGNLRFTAEKRQKSRGPVCMHVRSVCPLSL